MPRPLEIPSISICGKTILSRPSDSSQTARFSSLPYLPTNEEGPVFAEPWQAQAFAMAVQLSEAGHFTWDEWATALGEELRKAGAAADGSNYYEHWLGALERLVLEKRLTEREALRERRAAWIEAYNNTPHGQPVELERESTGEGKSRSK